MTDKDFFYVKHNDLIPSDRAIFDALNAATRYEELPSHYLAKIVGRNHKNADFTNRLKQLAHLGHLILYRPQSASKISKHYSYASKAEGFSKNDRPHRLLQNLVKASVEIGIKEMPGFDLHEWHEIANARDERGNYIVPKQTLDIIEKGGNPHRIPLKDSHVHPDGRPFLIAHGDHHLYVLGFEIDRNTEPLTTTKFRRNIAEKFKHYHEMYSTKAWQKHYGFDNGIIIWVFTNETRMHSAMRLYGDTYGPAKPHLFTTTEDWFYEPRYQREELGDFFTRSYLRVGCTPYQLDEFWNS